MSRKRPTLVQYRQRREIRLPIVSELYMHGHTYREIRQEVMARLGLPTYSLLTVKKDIDFLLAEWKKQRLQDIDDKIQYELSVIDNITKEAWSAWNKSKTDKTQRFAKQKGVPGASGGEVGAEISTLSVEQGTKELICYGDPRYLDIIDKQAKERRKLLGLYAPEKKEFTGMSFENFLIETGTDEE